MDTDLDPIVGNWYRHTNRGQLFRVVAYDEARGIVKLQHFDGDLEEIDASAWFDMEIEPAETPEEWTGPVAHDEADDLIRETSTRQRSLKEPREDSDTEEEDWDDDEKPEDDDDRDDWDDSGSDEAS